MVSKAKIKYRLGYYVFLAALALGLGLAGYSQLRPEEALDMEPDPLKNTRQGTERALLAMG